MENYSSTGALIDDLLKALEETRPSSPYGWYFTIEIDNLGLLSYTLRSTATDEYLKSGSQLAHLLPANYAYTKRGVEYHWHRYLMDLWKAGVLPKKPPTFDCNPPE